MEKYSTLFAGAMSNIITTLIKELCSSNFVHNNNNESNVINNITGDTAINDGFEV